MGAFVFHSTNKSEAEVQNEAVKLIDNMMTSAVQASLAYQSSHNSQELAACIVRLEDELGSLLDRLEHHIPLVRKKAAELICLLGVYAQWCGC
ncbi:TPA: hypothetical protein IBX06_004992 [Escherichia coli]|nr:hypothetical protein [Escherichia coli]HAM4818705.1 hypothetical protein [Escherichia coli]HAM4823316.1 hypothetical protein [Escherichia coli]HAM4842176.1 hypothetical protein [Escherichia coli]HAM4861785.1 hypothetical protein [Escherichia coli]